MNYKPKTTLIRYIGLWLVAFLIPFQVAFAEGTEVTQSGSRVTGTVVDRLNEPLIGASVEVKGTANGTVTDVNGGFTLSNVASDATIVISYIGYKTREIQVKGKTDFTITMDEDAQMLGEVVVEVGYNQVKRANILGSVASISATELEDIIVPSLSQALMDKIPGVTVGIASGSPLATPSLSIRVPGSWSSELPLYVIDGFIYEDKEYLDRLDPSEIESISILKDASAAVYGARGAGGVVLVTTKMGQAGKMKVNYSANVGWSDATQFPELMSAREQATALNNYTRAKYGWNAEDAYAGALANKDFSWFTDEELSTFDNLDYNWLDEGWKSSLQTRHNINFSGGSERMRYFASGSYMYQDGNFKNLSMNKYSVRLGVEVNVTKDLLAKASMSTSNQKDSRPYNSADGSEYDKMYFTYATLLRQPRWKPAYINGLPVGNDVSNHPLEVIDSDSYYKRNNSNYNMNLEFEYSFPWVSGLKANASFNYQKTSGFSKNYSKPYTLYLFDGTGGGVIKGNTSANGHILGNTYYDTKTITNNERISQSSSFSNNYQFNASLNYSKKIEEHDIFAMINYEQSAQEGNGLSHTLINLLIDNYESVGGFGRPDAQTGEIPIPDITDSRSNGGRQSFIGRLNYSFGERYLLEASFRYEASTRFAPGLRWGFFPSIAVGWRISEESFFKENVNPNIISGLKLRASFGRLGNDRATAFSWNYLYEKVSSGAYLGGTALSTGLQPKGSGITTRNTTWEKTDSYNFGIDINAFRNFSFAIDGFYKHAFDILERSTSSFPYQVGLGNNLPYENHGEQEAYGGEVSIAYNNRIGKDASYFVRGHFSYATSRVLEKYQSPAVVGTWADEIGKMTQGETGYYALGIIRNEEELQAYIDKYSKEGVLFTVGGSTPRVGMIALADIGGPNYSNEPDGIVDSNDVRIISKYSSPPYRYGLSFGGEWKGLRIDATLGGQFGHKVFYDKAVYTNGEGNRNQMDWLSESANNLKMWTDSWTPENPNAALPVMYEGQAGQRSTFWMRDGHTLTLRNINLSYVVPPHLYSKTGLTSLRVNFSANNLWNIVNPFPYKDANLSSWMDYPILRSFNFGISLTI